MARSEITRRYCRRGDVRYASDVTDAEWSLNEPFIPKTSPIGRPSARATASGGPRGYDALTRVNGRNRIVADTVVYLVDVQLHAADIQQRGGAAGVLAAIRELNPWSRHVFANGGYAWAKRRNALAELRRWTIQIVKRPTPPRASRFRPAMGGRLRGSFAAELAKDRSVHRQRRCTHLRRTHPPPYTAARDESLKTNAVF